MYGCIRTLAVGLLSVPVHRRPSPMLWAKWLGAVADWGPDT